MKLKSFILCLAFAFPLFGQIETQTVQIDSAGTLSAATNGNGKSDIVGLIVPKGTSPTINFKVSSTFDGTYSYLKKFQADSSAKYVVTLDSTIIQAVALDQDLFRPWQFLKIEAAAAVYDDKIITVISKRP
jgi:hypothetical protein